MPFGVGGRLGQPQPDRRDRADLRERPRPARPRLLREARAALQGGPREVRRPRREDVPARRRRPRRRRRPPRRPSCGWRRSSPRPRSTTSRCAIPKATDHKMTMAELQKLDAALRLDGLLQDARHRAGRPQRHRAEASCRRSTSSSARSRSPTGRPTSSGTCSTRPRRRSRTPFVQEDFAFNGAYLNGAKEMKPRWKRCAESTDRLLGEALGKKYVEKYFPPEAKARMQELVKNLRLAMGRDDRGARLDERGDEEEGAREALDLQPQDRLPGQVEGLQQGRRSRARPTGTTSSPAASSTSTTTSRRSASRSTAAAGA